MRTGVAVLIAGALAAAVTAGITIAIMVFAWPGCKGPNSPDPVHPPPDKDWYRPLFHYTPIKNWVNDPNGLMYYKGEYHLFYQYDMDSSLHKTMSWGHAVSTDLVHWKELPVAIPADASEQIFSGCLVVDEECTSGLCTKGNGPPALIAFYTSYKQVGTHIQSQHIATSFDLGRTWEKYKENPVLDENRTEFRDPKVIRRNGEWLMLVQRSEEHVLMFYKSADLIHWGQAVGKFGPAGSTDGVWECPDMFELDVDGDPNNRKAVLIVNINPGNPHGGSAGQYFIGHFDDSTNSFVSELPETEVRWLDWGMDYYATITWANVPDDRRLSIGWMSNWNYTEQTPTGKWGWRNGFSVPRELKLKTVKVGEDNKQVVLTQLPAAELSTLREGPVIQEDWVTVTDTYTGRGPPIRGRAVDISATFTGAEATEFGLRVHVGENQETVIGYDRNLGELFVDRTKSGNVDFSQYFPGRHAAPLYLEGDELRLRVVVDHDSVEVFANDGEVAITDLVYPDPAGDRIEFYAKGGKVTIKEYNIWRMNTFRKMPKP